MDKPIMEVFAHQMKDQQHTILVQPYMYGQFRIQLTDISKPDLDAPSGHGSIMRELCTYQADTMEFVCKQLQEAMDPEAVAESFAKSWNCEGPGGRIRLDTHPEDNPYRANQ